MPKRPPRHNQSHPKHVPTIACFNRATVDLGVGFDALIAALQRFVDEHVAPVWGTPAKLVTSKGFLKGAWALSFLDDADKAGALGYHDLTPEGYPQSRVFVKTTLANHERVSMAASHELVEMLVDPAINLMAIASDTKKVYGYEAADAVEEVSFLIDGIEMTDFVYPAYFEAFHKPGSVRFDHLGVIRKPFEIHGGGYLSLFEDGKWMQVHGSKSKRKRFAREDRRGHRSEQRGQRVHKRSTAR